MAETPEGSQTPSPDVPPRVRLSSLSPFLSVLVLEIQGTADPGNMFAQLVKRAGRRRDVPGTDIAVLAEGLDVRALSGIGVSFDQASAVIWRRTRTASWAAEGAPYVDVEHELMLCLRRGRFVAVSGPDSVQTAVKSWIDKKPPRPMIARVRPGVMNAALLASGEAKTMWLRNIRGSSARRPSAKTLSGPDLVPALDVIGDGSFSLGAARVAIPDDDSRQVFKGTVGASPQKARVWSRHCSDATEFLIGVDELLELIQSAADSGVELQNPYEVLSSRMDSLDGVRGGFEFRYPMAADLTPDASPDEVLAVQALESVTVATRSAPSGPDVILHVGFDGITAGQLRVAVTMENSAARMAIGHEGEGTDPQTVATIRQLLQAVGGHSIHYLSGHAVMDGAVYQVRQETAWFTGWDFRDMTGYQVAREKPAGCNNPHQIHAAIGKGTDNSMFAWVAKTYTDGALLCDDGPGEIADFLHVADDGTLSLIHVKAAGSSSLLRQIAVAHYEVVVSQAVKNLANLNLDHLAQRLRDSPIATPAAWSQGQRVTGREDFLESLAYREVVDPVKIVVVQPHVTYDRHRALRGMDASSQDPDVHRLRLLDTLLNTASWACTGSNAVLSVVGCR